MENLPTIILTGLLFCLISFLTGYYLNRPTVVKNRKFRELSGLEIIFVFLVAIGYPIIYFAAVPGLIMMSGVVGGVEMVVSIIFVFLVYWAGDFGLKCNDLKKPE